MRRVIVYYEWKELWWVKEKEHWTTGNDSINYGIRAYAQKQAYLCKCLAQSFAIAWLPFLQSKGVVPEWKPRYDYLVSSKNDPRVESVLSNTSVEQDDNNDGIVNEDEDEEVDEEELYIGEASYDTFELDE